MPRQKAKSTSALLLPSDNVIVAEVVGRVVGAAADAWAGGEIQETIV